MSSANAYEDILQDVVGQARTGSHPGPLYLCMYVPELPAQARLRNRPKDRGKAVAILDGVPPLEQVCSVTKKAMRDGIRHGTTRVELDSYGEVLALPRSLAEERVARDALSELAHTFTPRMQSLTMAAENTCVLVLDVSGTESLFGPVRHLLRQVQHAIGALGLYARIAVSGNYYAAACAAPFAPRNGTVIEPSTEAQVLKQLPIAALFLTPQQAGTLDLWGVRTCGDLAALPETGLIARMGQAGKALRLLARGEQNHFLVPTEEVFRLEEFRALESSVELLDSLLSLLGPMLDQLITRACARSLALASVTVRLWLDGAASQDSAECCSAASEYVRVIKPALPLADLRLLLNLVHLDLQAHPPSAAIVALYVQAEAGGRGRVQLGLFSPQMPEASRLDITLARLTALVGEGRVGSSRLLNTHRSDSFVMERFGSAPENACALATSTHNDVVLTLRRLRPPVPLQVDTLTGAPNTFVWHNKQHIVLAAYGPWRQSGEWWNTSIWSREEWDVRAMACADKTILLGVLVHDRLRQQWQLEAFYD